VKLRNDASIDLYQLEARLETIEAADVLEQLKTMNFPILLYTQDQMKEWMEGASSPARPFDLKGAQERWIEIFQISEPFAWYTRIRSGSQHIDFAALPGMVMQCAIYGCGDPTKFSIVYNENDQNEWNVKLIRSDGTEIEVPGYPQ
jgi:hypothetical protein